MTGPIMLPTNVDAVAKQLGLDPSVDRNDLADTVNAVCDLVLHWKGPPPAAGWATRHQHGATMLAARIYRRRNSPAGVESFGELGPIYVQRNDPDVAQLLDLGTYTRPAVG